MSLLINTLLDRVKTEFELPGIIWEDIKLSSSDIKFLKDECSKESEFDPTNRRKQMLEGLLSGKAPIGAAKCEYGQIAVVFESMDQIPEMPWDLWGRILRMFYEKTRKPFKVFLLAKKDLRVFPPKSEPIMPININGGYTYRCNPETIMIYRAEDATRVLIHELQHSCCLDRDKHDLDEKEAETEAWAELFYVAILSKGKKFIFNDLLRRQSEWMIKQNKKVKQHMNNPDSREFPWRYTIGKEEIWERWGILSIDFMTPYIDVGNSLRLTFPPNNMLKLRFNVSRASVIL